jgi:RNA polymerase sigma-70 factor (ECF subfamily)
VKVYQSYDDGELLLLIKKDDDKAFRVLYERYWKKLLIQAHLKLQSTEQSEEIIQTIFINLWRRRHTIELKYSFHTYVASMLKYEILHQLAINRKERNFKGNVSALYVVEDHSTRNWLDYEQLRAEIEKSVQSLPEKCQLVFRLSRENGLTEKQIAEALDIAPKTVQAHMGKALKQLRTSVQQLFYLLSTLSVLFVSSAF